MSLRQRLSGWDGRRKEVPLSVCADFQDDPCFAPQLISLCAEPDCADAATWCLKHLYEGGARFDLKTLAGSVIEAPGWAAKLHVLQILVAADEPGEPSQLEILVKQTIASKRPMLRAWGYSGADLLARHAPNYEAWARSVLKEARSTESAGSIKARLKRCRF